jgi:hypothetical protein
MQLALDFGDAMTPRLPAGTAEVNEGFVQHKLTTRDVFGIQHQHCIHLVDLRVGYIEGAWRHALTLFLNVSGIGEPLSKYSPAFASADAAIVAAARRGLLFIDRHDRDHGASKTTRAARRFLTNVLESR